MKEYKTVCKINNFVHKVFGRRFSNVEEFIPRKSKEQRIVVITPVYNSENYIKRCIDSVNTQDYENYLHIIIDDASTDNTLSIKEDSNDISSLIFLGSLANLSKSIYKFITYI